MTPSRHSAVLPRGRLRHGLFQLLIAASLALSATHLQPYDGSALALMGDQTNVPGNTFGTLSLGASTALTGSPQGHDVNLSWSSGQDGTGYAVTGVANGASNDCSGASFTAVGTATATNYADAERYSPQGIWFCYQVATTVGTWSSQANNPVVAVQLGFVASAVSLIQGGDTIGCDEGTSGAASALDCGDQVVISFNQPMNVDTGPDSSDSVCADDVGDTLWLGSSITTGACSSAETTRLGTLTGSSVSGCDCRFSASYGWDTGGRTLTVTIGARTTGDGYPTLGGSLWTFKPTTDTAHLLSSTGAFHVCDTNSSSNNCWPETQ